ncbi:TOBE domain-containing protein [Wenyingzhuangia sp. 1_MG-2023]|nr:TOBE domain-containing protein [Wenyingzhuangia sp. 1_MG-2023]
MKSPDQSSDKTSDQPASAVANPLQSASLQGSIWMQGQERPFAREQVELLQAIADTGSISAAGKQVGVSYKTAWDRIDTMNNMADQPLVARAAGGARGGGTVWTDYGERMLAGFLLLQEAHEIFLQRIRQRVQSLGDVTDDISDLLRAGQLKTSARNQFRGVVEAVVPGAVNSDVLLRITSDHLVTAQITAESFSSLEITPGQTLVALIKAPAVMLSNDLDIQLSTSNKLVGTVARITRGAVNADVVLALADGKTISAVISNHSLDALALQQQQPACALFEASSVVLVVDV